MADPIMLKHAKLHEIPIKGFYRDVGMAYRVDGKTHKVRQCRVVEESGRPGFSYYVQNPKREGVWEFLDWSETYEAEAPIPLVVRKFPVITPAVPPGGTLLRYVAPASASSHKPGDIVHAGKSTFKVQGDGSWVSISAPAPVAL